MQIPADPRFPFEGHCELPSVPCALRFVQALYLRLGDRPTRFLSGIDSLIVVSLNGRFWERNVTTLRVWEPQLMDARANVNWIMAWFAETSIRHVCDTHVDDGSFVGIDV
jgi:hypothetical protein